VYPMKKLLEHIKKQQEARAEEQAKLEAQKQKNILEAERVYKLEEQRIKEREQKEKEVATAKRKKLQEDAWNKKINEGMALVENKIKKEIDNNQNLSSILKDEEARQAVILEREKKRQVRLRISREAKAREEKERKNKITQLLKTRETMEEVYPDVLSWESWNENPINKQIFLLDKDLAEDLYYDDREYAARYKRTKGSKKKQPTTITAFAPSDLSGLNVWMDADFASSITLDGDNVIQWESRIHDVDMWADMGGPDPEGNVPAKPFWGAQTAVSNAPSYVDHPSGKKTIQFDENNNERLDLGISTSDGTSNDEGWDWYDGIQGGSGKYPAFTMFFHGNMASNTMNYLLDIRHPRSLFYYASGDNTINIFRDGTHAATASISTGEQLWTFSNVESPKFITSYTLTAEATNPGMLSTASADLTLQTLSNGNDDINSSQINLSGSFTFNGTIYSTSFMNSNGFMTLGSAFIGSSHNNTQLDDQNTNVVLAPWWDDLVVESDGAQAHYFANDKYWIFQWHCRRYGTDGVKIRMQAVIYLDNHSTQPGTVEFRYNEIENTTFNADTDASVGVKGDTSALTADNPTYIHWRDFALDSNKYASGLQTSHNTENYWPANTSPTYGPGGPYYYKFSPTVQEEKHKTKIFVDGLEGSSNFCTEVVDLGNYFTEHREQVLGGRYDYSATNAFGGTMNEIIVYDRILTDDERAKVETYLADKWGTTVATRSVG